MCRLTGDPCVSFEGDENQESTALYRVRDTAAQQHRQPGALVAFAPAYGSRNTQNLRRSNDGSRCCWDGWLHNRKELLLRIGDSVDADASDATIALALFHREGVIGLGGLIGDWRLCIWDALNRTVILASDYAGVRPLYYHFGAGALYWSSDLTHLISWTGRNTLDELYIANFLVRGNAAERTPYVGVRAILPSHAVIGTANGVSTTRLWNLPFDQEVRYSVEGSYEERLLELFREAVQVRIDGQPRICAELSGGLDSSSVVCMAKRVLNEAGDGGALLNTFSYTHEQCTDEKYFREVERVSGLSGHHLDLQAYAAAAAGGGGSAPTWWNPRYHELARLIETMKASVFLTGQFGDMIMGNTTDDTAQVTELLVHGRFLQAGQEAYHWARALRVPIYPILWRSFRETCSSWVSPIDPRDSVAAMEMSAETSLSPRIASDLRDHDIERLSRASWRQAPPGRRRRFRAVQEALESRNLTTPELLSHVSYTHPFTHRPLVEFMLTVPARIVCAPGQPRRLMRRAFSGLLPRMVLNRKSKAAYTLIYRNSLLPLASAMLQRPRDIQVVERGYIESPSLISRLEQFRRGLDCNEPQLRQIMLLEFWLRNM